MILLEDEFIKEKLLEIREFPAIRKIGSVGLHKRFKFIAGNV